MPIKSGIKKFEKREHETNSKFTTKSETIIHIKKSTGN